MTRMNYKHPLPLPLPLLQILQLLLLILACGCPQSCLAFDYVLAPSSLYRIRLVEVTTNISDVPTLFDQSNSSVHVDGLAWQGAAVNTNATTLSTARLEYKTFFNDELVDQGSHDLSVPGTVPPTTVTAGYLVATSTGRVNVSVTLQVVYDDTDANNNNDNDNSPIVLVSRPFQVYWPIMTLLPVLVMMGLAYLTGNVEITVSTANLVTVWISQGGLFRGMEKLVYGCILGALTDTYNGVIMLLVFFLSGIVSVAQVAGGTTGWIGFCRRTLRLQSTRMIQFMAVVMGMAYFWDDVLSMLLVGHVMRPLLDDAHTSRPVTAWIMDGTATPITGLVMLSTWLVWEIPLLQQELNRIDHELGNIPAETMTPWQVLQESLPFMFYPIFYLILLPLLVTSQRHMGPLLMYERITQVYQAKNGGPTDIRGPCQPNKNPAPTTPCRSWNLLIPMISTTLLFVVFWLQSGNRMVQQLNIDDDESEEWIFMPLIHAITPLAWLQAISMAAAIHVISILLQFKQGDSILFLPFCLPTLWKQAKLKKLNNNNNNKEQHLDDESVFKAPHHDHQGEDYEEGQSHNCNGMDDDGENSTICNANHNTTTTNDGIMRQVHPSDDNENNNDNPIEIIHLLPMMDLISTFFYGFARVMPYMIQLILSFALRASLTELGLDRWFAVLLGQQLELLQIPYLPIAAFLTAFFMSLATGGASRGKVASILLPMMVAPVYQRTHVSHPNMIFQVIGAILSGCIAGDHASPLSNSTLLSSLASDCHVLIHILTQIPYIGVTVMLSLLLGTGPVGYGVYPVGAGFFLGIVAIMCFVFFMCYPVFDPSGQWDLLTRIYIRCWAARQPRRNNSNNNHEIIDEDGDEGAATGHHNHQENDPKGNFWEILQRDTARAATAIPRGLPYETEDCRHLMHPMDSAVTISDHDSIKQWQWQTNSNSDGDSSTSVNLDTNMNIPADAVVVEPNQRYPAGCSRDAVVDTTTRRVRIIASDVPWSTSKA